MNILALAGLPAAQLKAFASTIGNTPLQPIEYRDAQSQQLIYLKLEGANPTGSMKDRTGYALLEDLEDRGLLEPGATIIESTSGNLGVALAFQCKARGYRFIAVVDPKTTVENCAKMEAFGAQIELVTQPDLNGGYLLSRLARIQQLCQEHPSLVWTNQYHNTANPAIHYTQTGPEIYQQMEHKVDVIFISVSTGGSLAGIGRFFREVSPQTQIIGVDAYGSVVFGTPSAPRKLTGIGSSRPSQFLKPELYDTHLLVTDEEAFSFCRALSAQTGLMVGGSSGAVLAACTRYLALHPTLKRAVCVCADRGENYLSSIFHDEWFPSHNLPSFPHQLRLVEVTHPLLDPISY
ncbi:2,3-diaminopropionate biosynthesis protein SbnA [Tengunoibacter tsumagoiensis]|uniref:N-(2-amino-2-carboxyethyl)-L-glutamate synthase n=1 Tax=Tengunoibacter tsumagoiensis TaxID=2014871 RepID=A0A402A5V4_9CHLR|nr:2,3-diaminopropionate biosynthesis protein SbnA [Tengunoibacter tsumagoiensis]GCE14518.1 2,3-diaminopropionate biosynthesis protein SbnA [Tengunoibacter tsumagoiensis]